MRRNSGAYTSSPGTPEYGDHLPKAPLPSTSSSIRRQVALTPLSSVRTVPSKWDDAERWITSPFNTAPAQPHTQPKSKSGPLASTGLPHYSPTMSLHESGSVKNFMPNSTHDGSSGIAARSNSSYAMLNGTTEPSSQDEKVDGGKEDEAWVLRRDMATQMSPQNQNQGSTHSSSKRRLSMSSSVPTSARQHRNPAPSVKDDIRDVQVDKGTNTSSHQRLQGVEVGDVTAVWNVSESSKNMSKLQREEAEITAWENLQRAKAEAALRKLEMKLEKKRSASMEKIANKLRAAQTKAQAMRNSLSSDTNEPSTSSKRKSCSIFLKICSICNCCMCTKR